MVLDAEHEGKKLKVFGLVQVKGFLREVRPTPKEEDQSKLEKSLL